MSIYVIPDIHGEYDKLLRLMKKINEVKESEDTLVFLGDYIDRGNKSKEVIDYICKLHQSEDHIITLLGNHDEAFWNGVENIDNLDIYNVEWFARYCIETLDSYGINTQPLKSFNLNQNEFYREYFDNFVKEIREFKSSYDYKKLKYVLKRSHGYYIHENYVFSHSGGVGDIPIEEQSLEQLLWSRDFRPRNDGYIHVCGHTPTISGEVEEHNEMLLCDVGAVFRDIELPFIKLEE